MSFVVVLFHTVLILCHISASLEISGEFTEEESKEIELDTLPVATSADELGSDEKTQNLPPSPNDVSSVEDTTSLKESRQTVGDSYANEASTNDKSAADGQGSEEGLQDTEVGEELDLPSEDNNKRKLFSLTNVIKSLLNPVIEEFQEGLLIDKGQNANESVNSNSSNSAENVTAAGAADKEGSKNGTEGGKKFRFQCVGRNVTDNTTIAVRLVNSTVLLDVLSFNKNQSSNDCVLVMFYAPWCHFCAKTAPHYNALARAFPQLDVLAVDAVHFSNLNARFGTVAVPNIMLFHQSRSAVRFNSTIRTFTTFVNFVKNVTGLEPNSTVNVTEADYLGPLSSSPSQESDYLLWFAWVFVTCCSTYIFVNSHYGQQAINRVRVLWQEHQHIE